MFNGDTLSKNHEKYSARNEGKGQGIHSPFCTKYWRVVYDVIFFLFTTLLVCTFNSYGLGVDFYSYGFKKIFNYIASSL